MKTKIALDNGLVRAVFQLDNGTISEKYFAVNGKKICLIAESVPSSNFSVCLLAAEEYGKNQSHVVPDYRSNPPKPEPDFFKPLLSVGEPAPVRLLRFYDHDLEKEDEISRLTFYAKSSEGDEVERTISLMRGEANFRITNRLKLTEPISLEFFVDRYSFSPGSHPDFTWTPSIKRDPACVSADWTFKSPTIIVQKGSLGLSLVPDLNLLSKTDILRKCNLGLDLDINAEPKPLVTFGLIPSVPHYHSAFIHPKGLRATLSQGTLDLSYFLLPFANAKERQVYREIVSFLWNKFGHDNLLQGHVAQLKLFKRWEKEAWHEFADKIWFEFEYNGEKCGALKCGLFGFKDDAWFCAWWNNMRTAYGLELYGRHTGDRQSTERAHRILNLVLKAPRKNGAFPIVYNRDTGTHHWDPDHHFGGYRDLYHNFDMSWTCYWLLKWLEDLGPQDKRILPLCVAYGDFLVKNQYESGFIPSYYDNDLRVKLEVQFDKEKIEPASLAGLVEILITTTGKEIRLNKESAEPAACAVFLTELYKVTGKKKYLNAATKAMYYIEQYIIPENKWFDYETFLSCSPKPYDFYDPITGQQPQNNMCIIQTAKAFLALYDLTKEKRFIEQGTAVLDYLSLTQQVWSHPLLSPNLIGGFTTQNSDAEWSDARQAYCADLYLDYFERTGIINYLERGIAALRASFAVSPYENWAHDGYSDRPGALSGFHWGLGSGMASVEMMWERYGDVLVNSHAGWAYGINGCTVEKFSLKDDTISLTIISEFEWDTPIRVVFRDVSFGKYKLIINDVLVGEFLSTDLENGISWFFTK